MSFLYIFISGILIGAAMISPGVSGGVLAVILGIYNNMIESLTNIFSNFKKNFIFLFVLSIGVFFGAVFFSKMLIYLYFKYELETKFMFIGLILGGVPYLFKQIKDKLQKPKYYLVVITFIISLLFFKLTSNIGNLNINTNLTFSKMFISGFIYSIGKVVPGISSSFLLMLIGMYEYVLNIIANFFLISFSDIKNMFPFMLGFIFGVIILLKIVNYLLKSKFNIIYSIIIGFVISSVFILFPNINTPLDIMKGIFILLVCFTLSYKFSN